MPNWDRKRKKDPFDALRIADLRARPGLLRSVGHPARNAGGRNPGPARRSVLPGDPDYDKDRKL